MGFSLVDVPANSETAFDLVLGRSPLDRAAHRRTDPTVMAQALTSPTSRVVDVYGDRVTSDVGLDLRAPQSADLRRLTIYLGLVGGADVFAAVRDEEAPDAASGLRELGMRLSDDEIGILVSAVAMANWHASNVFCPRCGNRTDVTEAGWVRHCSQCGADHYPRTDAAVIMSVIDDDDRLLLAQGTRFKGAGRWMSVLAGFVEPGESLEAAVAREVHEEVGVVVDDVRFLADQPWPFPASLMVGFAAHARTTDLTLDPTEIVDAQWFSRDELAHDISTGALGIPPRLSIARHIIEHWYGGPLPRAPRPAP